MLKKISLWIGILLVTSMIFGQSIKNHPFIHSHNDYQRSMPFYEAFINGASSIEMDIHLLRGELYVSHDVEDIKEGYTIEELYIKPLLLLLQRRQLDSYTAGVPLQYLVDIKSESHSTLAKLVLICSKYPELFGDGRLAAPVQLVISGNSPQPKDYDKYPNFIKFDGRPYINYTTKQLSRIALISDNFKNYSHWNGKGRLIDQDLEKIEKIISYVHNLGKPIRFWATPDSKSSWEAFFQLGVDYINTDNTKAVSEYFKRAKNSRYKSVNQHDVIELEERSFSETKNVILMIGDGMGLAQLSAGLLANKGQLYMGTVQNYGFLLTQSADDFTTDSAAGATAMATGVKTKNRFIGMDDKGNPVESLVVIAHKNNMKTGIITTDDLTGATPSSFYAHQLDRDMSINIVNDFTESDIDLFIGNGKRALDSLFEKGIEAVRKNGFTPIIDQLDHLSDYQNSKPVVFISNTNAMGKDGNPLLLKNMTSSAIDFLNSENKNGFFLMVESAYIDSGGHHNNIEQVVEEVLSFDKAVGIALEFAQKEGNTLVIITADHETGGMSLPQGNFANGMVQAMFHSKDHTGIIVPVMAYGPGAHLFSGMYQNVEIYHKIVSLLELGETNN